jgi:hypothetical protein
MHGPVRGGDGAYYISINLADGGDGSTYKAGGKYMGAQGGLSGWNIRVEPNGKFELWANGLRSNAVFAQSNYTLTIRDLEAVVFEALHSGVSIHQAGQHLLGYYCGDKLPVQQGIMQRVCSFLKPAEGRAGEYLTCKPLAQRRKHGLFFVGESGVGKTTMCLKAIDTLKRPYFAMSQSDDELWTQVTLYLQKLQQSDPHDSAELERQMNHFGEHQLREKAVLVAAKCGLVLFIDELNTDRNLRLEETLNQVRDHLRI